MRIFFRNIRRAVAQLYRISDVSRVVIINNRCLAFNDKSKIAPPIFVHVFLLLFRKGMFATKGLTIPWTGSYVLTAGDCLSILTKIIYIYLNLSR